MKKFISTFCGILILSPTAIAGVPTRQVSLPGTDKTGASVSQFVTLADLGKVTWGSLPPISQSGSFDGTSYVQTLGYDLSRSWQSGDSPDSILKLGDISESFGSEQFNLNDIANISKSDLDNTPLSDFALVKIQTLKHLANIVPNLAQKPLYKIPPVAALVNKFFPSLSTSNLTLGNLLARSPQLGSLELGSIDLASFPISDLPNLEFVQLMQFEGWENSFIKDIPGLNAVPFASFPIPVIPDGNQVARIDFIWSEKEGNRKKTVSGSNVEGFNVPCSNRCAHVELDNLENVGASQKSIFEGVQWISGKFQTVKGGRGALAAVNGGREPTGRHPYGSGFKVAIWDVDESQETANTALFFRFCGKFIGCSPYILGPFPFLSYKRDAAIFTGNVTVPNSLPVPNTSLPNIAVNPSPSLPGTVSVGGDLGDFTGANPSTLEQTISGINLPQLIAAIAQVESSSNYREVGAYVCAGSDCGVALGRYQFMPYRDDVKNAILSIPGGDAFLNKALKGESISGSEMDKFFPAYLQDELMQSWIKKSILQAAGEIDPTTGTYFTKERLVQRVAQKHFGGEGVAIDSTATDGAISVFAYGVKVSDIYKS